MGIRYGRVPKGSEEVEWHFVSHCECDGIGGFAQLLRERGADLRELPQTKNSCRSLIVPLWRLWRASFENHECADRSDWLQQGAQQTGASGAVAWHIFTEAETMDILAECRRNHVTVNSLLLKHLDQAIRPEILRPHMDIPWMIPVNMRGDITHVDDTENHVSCIEARIAPEDSAGSIQKQILLRLQRGEHRANHLLLGLGKVLSHRAKVKFLIRDRAKPAGNIGAFSNLGVWDADKILETDDAWLFCPPVVKGQLLAAGCVTFRNRLSITVDLHPGQSSPELTGKLIRRWVNGIRNVA